MKLTSTQNIVRFSDIHRVAEQANQELQGENPRPELVDFFEGGKSADLAVYNNVKSLESVASRVEQGQDPSVDELRSGIADGLNSKLKVARYAAYGTFGAVALAFTGGLVHNAGWIDLGTVGQFLHQNANRLIGAATVVSGGFHAASSALASEPKKQIQYLDKMAGIVERQKQFENQAAAAQAVA